MKAAIQFYLILSLCGWCASVRAAAVRVSALPTTQDIGETNSVLVLNKKNGASYTTSGLTVSNLYRQSAASVYPRIAPFFQTNKLLSVPAGNDALADMVAGNSQFAGQIGASWYGSLNPIFLWAASEAGSGSNGWRGQFMFPGGLYQIGHRYAMPKGGNNHLDLYFNGNPEETRLSTASTRDATSLTIHNPNVFTDGAWLLMPMYTTNPAFFTPPGVANATVTNRDGVPIGVRDQFGLQFGTIPFEQRAPDKNLQPGSYQIILGAGGGVPFYITANAGFSNETAFGFPIQHSYYCADQTKYQSHFGWWITNVWEYTNTMWRDAFMVDHLTSRVEVGVGTENAPNSTLYLGHKFLEVTNNVLRAIFGPRYPDDSTPGVRIFFTTNVHFGANSDPAAFTFDASTFYRFGIVKQAGVYSVIAAAAGSPLILAQSSGSSLQANIASQTMLHRMHVTSSEVTLTESSATVVINITLAANKSLSARIFASTRADDATNFQERGDNFIVSAVNKAGTITAAISTIGADSTAAALSSGTLGTTWTVVQNGNAIDIKNSAVSSLTQTTLKSFWRVELDSNDATATITPIN